MVRRRPVHRRGLIWDKRIGRIDDQTRKRIHRLKAGFPDTYKERLGMVEVTTLLTLTAIRRLLLRWEPVSIERLALETGKSEGQVRRDLLDLRKTGCIEYTQLRPGQLIVGLHLLDEDFGRRLAIIRRMVAMNGDELERAFEWLTENR